MAFDIEDLYVAYRKAKQEAWHENLVAYGLKFALFEENLTENLTMLLSHFNSDTSRWFDNVDAVGELHSVPRAPKAIPLATEEFAFVECDPTDEWNSFLNGGDVRIQTFRPVISASVELLVLSSLWTIEVGALFDDQISQRHVYGNRIRRKFDFSRPIDRSNHSLFKNWQTQYKRWQSARNRCLTEALESDQDLLVISLDIENFFHSIDPQFILEELEPILVGEKRSDHLRITHQLLGAFSAWNQANNLGPAGIPVGLPASSVIANRLLKSLDDAVIQHSPLFYGRYVDDISIVVMRHEIGLNSKSVFRWLDHQIGPIKFTESPQGPDQLTLSLPNHDALTFSSKKASVHRLRGKSGLDLLRALNEDEQERSSEQRLREPLDADASLLGKRSLLTGHSSLQIHDANHHEATELTKVRSARLRKAAFSQMLTLMDQYDSDLDPNSWEDIRLTFYGLIERHALTPEGLYLYGRRFHRIWSLMVSCEDYDWAEQLTSKMHNLEEIIPNDDLGLASKWWSNLYEQLLEACLAAYSTTPNLDKFVSLLNLVRGRIAQEKRIEIDSIEENVHKLQLSDWARKSYAELWLAGEAPKRRRHSQPVALLSESVEKFRRNAGLKRYEWAAIAFPTRSITEIRLTSLLPLSEIANLNEYLESFKGYRTTMYPQIRTRDNFKVMRVAHPPLTVDKDPESVYVGVSSVSVSLKEWKNSLVDPVPTTRERYNKIKRIVADALRERKIDYLTFPELCIPRRWMFRFASQLSDGGVSMIAGVEYLVEPGKITNQCLLSLKCGSITIARFENKGAPSWQEAIDLKKAKPRKIFNCGDGETTIYSHFGFVFSALICSDLTNLALRQPLRGAVDALFVLEWNPDTDGFSHIVRSSSLDLHAFIVQVNNRLFGDSWIRGPFKEAYERDVLRIKGGVFDYLVVGEIEHSKLRVFQMTYPPMSGRAFAPKADKPVFKPVPIGFEMSPLRRRKRARRRNQP